MTADSSEWICRENLTSFQLGKAGDLSARRTKIKINPTTTFRMRRRRIGSEKLRCSRCIWWRLCHCHCTPIAAEEHPGLAAGPRRLHPAPRGGTGTPQPGAPDPPPPAGEPNPGSAPHRCRLPDLGCRRRKGRRRMQPRRWRGGDDDGGQVSVPRQPAPAPGGARSRRDPGWGGGSGTGRRCRASPPHTHPRTHTVL